MGMHKSGRNDTKTPGASVTLQKEKQPCQHKWYPLFSSHNNEFSGAWRCEKCNKQVWGSPE
jgi:hypothetical protein